MRILAFPAVLVAVGLAHAAGFPGRQGGDAPLGKPAPRFGLEHWLNTGPLEPEALRGEVLLVRWWTDTCPFCSTSAPTLRELHEAYSDRGLRVIGIFHPKPPGDDSIDRFRRAARRFEFEFPVALDADWTALRRWWLDLEPGAWTSVSFLVDRAGIVRWVHPGGEYHDGPGGDHWPDHATCRREKRELVERIESLLRE